MTGSARDVLAQPAFVRIWAAGFLSNTGRWMQSIAQGVLAWKLTGSPSFLGALVFAQLGPLGLLSLVGGSLADSVDRRRLLLFTQIWQMIGSGIIALVLFLQDDVINPTLLFVLVLGTGLAQGIYAPTFTSILPSLAGGPRNLGAAISLNSSQQNLSRVVGPALGGILTSQFGFAEVFAINALTYVFVIGAVWVTTFPEARGKVRGLADRLFGGFRIASRAAQVGRPLLVMCVFAFFCLPFIGQLPALAELHLAIDSRSSLYGYFYACFGIGALSGTLLVATMLVRRPRPTTARVTLVCFGVALAWLATRRTASAHVLDELQESGRIEELYNSGALERDGDLIIQLEQIGAIVPVGFSDLVWAYLAVYLVGLFYLVLPTTLTTMWQEHVDESVRGRVAAVWILSFGGTVPFANLAAGPLVEAFSLQTVMLAGSVMALVLAAGARFASGPVVGEELTGSRRPAAS